MSIEHRVLIRSAGRLAFYPEDPGAPACCTSDATGADLCPSCAAALASLKASGLIQAPKPKPRAATKAPAKKPAAIVMRAACPVGADGRTAEERASDAALAADLRELGVSKLRDQAPAADRSPTRTARRRRSVYAEPRGYSAAVGRPITRPRGLTTTTTEQPTPEERAEDQADDRAVDELYGIIRSAFPSFPEDSLLGMPRSVLEEWAADIQARRNEADEEFEAAVAAAEKALPRGISKAMAKKRTELQQADDQIRAASRSTEIEGGLFPYSREIARRETLAEVAAGRQEPLERPKRHDPATPPKPYTRALEARKEAA